LACGANSLSSYNFVSGGAVVGYGMRNEVGMTFDGNNMYVSLLPKYQMLPKNEIAREVTVNLMEQMFGAYYSLKNVLYILKCMLTIHRLWGVENSGDNFSRGGKDIHKDNPAEKLNYVGDVVNPKGTWFGYPVRIGGISYFYSGMLHGFRLDTSLYRENADFKKTCFAVGDPTVFTDAKFKVGDQFVISPNTTFKDDTCTGVVSHSFSTQSSHLDMSCEMSAPWKLYHRRRLLPERCLHQ
jgi:acetyltransferase-like isoleucine patch superfamily enzyme